MVALGAPPARDRLLCGRFGEHARSGENGVRVMREAGRTVSFNPNLRPTLWESTEAMRHEIYGLAAQADWVLPGLEEGRSPTGETTPEAVAR
jgi:2-dehydro-3-deoxygluconokinase